ncbi:MAG: ribosome maturation factor RimM [Capsulimonadaceae bacterium]|nr:ribosome maturation factor RimM [Capsulimonadaceae bacterium]
MPQTQFETLVGSIIGAHGVQGTVKVKLATPTALALIVPPKRANADQSKPAIAVWVGSSPESGGIYRVISAKRQEPKELYLVRFVEANDRTAAEALVGKRIYAPDDRRLPLDADEYYVQDLIGLNVVADSGRSLGKVVQVIPNPANDVYETDAGALIPAVKAFVVKVDPKNGQILVHDIPGLMPEEQEPAEPGEQADGVPTGDATAQPMNDEPAAEEPAGLALIKTRRFGGKR